MGIVFWFVPIFMAFLIVNLILYIFKEQVAVLPKDENLSKNISIIRKVSESLYNYLSVHLIIPLTSVTIYMWYEYGAKGCLDLECFISEVEISGTSLVKLGIVVTIVLVIG
jgi:hypothetical protein